MEAPPEGGRARELREGLMRHPVVYTRGERYWLLAVAVLGFLVVNGAFVYALLFRPEAMREAMRNPLSAAFMAEALLLVVLLAYLFRKWGVSRISSGWFIVLSLLGSLAFAIPLAALLADRRREER